MKSFFKIISVCLVILILQSSLYSQAKKRDAKILQNSNLGKIEKLDVLDTKYLETNISITPSGRYMYFETNRPSPWSTKNYSQGRYDSDIWFSRLVDGKWQEPANVGQTINTPQSEGEPNISPDGQTMYFQSWRNDWKETGGPYYKAELKGENWVNPVGLNSGLTEFFKEKETDKNRKTGKSMGTDGATFSPDGKTFIFSFGLDYYGNMDIYITKKNKKGEWSKPKLLPISTDYNDRCPFLAADGKTLYFASNGYEGFGKMDIYKTTINEDGTCGEVINIGEPFNTKDDDYGFLITSSGNDIYLVRNEDIFHMDITNAITDIKPTHTIILSGSVRDGQNNEPLEAKIVIIESDTKKEIGISRSNSKTGEYSIVVYGGKKYQVLAKKDGYGDFTGELKTGLDPKENEITYNIILNPGKAIAQKVEPAIENPKPDTEKVEQIIEKTKQVTEKEEECTSKLYNRSYSIGINPAYPLALGIKTETHFNNFGASLIGMYMPGVGKYDDPKVPDDLNSANYTTIFLASVNYNYPLFKCKFYPNIGLFTGVRTRYWKKPLDASQNETKEGSYSDYPWGFTLGGKLFISDRLYIDVSVGLGRFAFHVIPSGDITKYEFKYIPWFTICYMFE
jgi:hypothetical protein